MKEEVRLDSIETLSKSFERQGILANKLSETFRRFSEAASPLTNDKRGLVADVEPFEFIDQ